jgi:hypothetical protein
VGRRYLKKKEEGNKEEKTTWVNKRKVASRRRLPGLGGR